MNRDRKQFPKDGKPQPAPKAGAKATKPGAADSKRSIKKAPAAAK